MHSKNVLKIYFFLPLSGKMWMHEHFDLKEAPDLVTNSKKMLTGGIYHKVDSLYFIEEFIWPYNVHFFYQCNVSLLALQCTLLLSVCTVHCAIFFFLPYNFHFFYQCNVSLLALQCSLLLSVCTVHCAMFLF